MSLLVKISEVMLQFPITVAIRTCTDTFFVFNLIDPGLCGLGRFISREATDARYLPTHNIFDNAKPLGRVQELGGPKQSKLRGLSGSCQVVYIIQWVCDIVESERV